MDSERAVGGTVTVLSGIRVDIGSGAATRPGWVGLDNRGHPAVTHVWDLEQMPWPLADRCAVQVYAGHVVARINPARFGFIWFMNEVWRLLQPGCEFLITTYYGVGTRYIGDAAACNPVNESTFYSFDPAHKSGLWHVYQPQPWQICDMSWVVEGNIEVLLRKRS